MARVIGRRIKCRASRKSIPGRMNFDGKVTITAKGENKQKTINLIAYRGGPMIPSGFTERVIVDLDGCKFHKTKSPIIGDHDTKMRIGHTTKQLILKNGVSAKSSKGETLDGPLIYAEGVPSSSMGVARGFVEDAANGFPFQVSIGADIDDAYFVDEDEKVVVNGKRWKGPLIVASKTSISELSVCVLGADRNTSATLAARNSNNKEIYSMTFSAWLKSMGLEASEIKAASKAKLQAKWRQEMKASKTKSSTATAPRRRIKATKSTDEDPAPRRRAGSAPRKISAAKSTAKEIARLRELKAAESNRFDGIERTFNKFKGDFTAQSKVVFEGRRMSLQAFKQKALSDGDITQSDVELTLLRASIGTPERKAPAAHMVQQIRDMPSEIIAAAVTRQNGTTPAREKNKVTGKEYGYEVYYKEKVLEASDNPHLKNLSLHQLMDMVHIQAHGHSYHGNRKTDSFIQATRQAMRKIEAAGPTTMNLTTIFEDSGYKTMWAAYDSVETTWEQIAKVVTVTDFKTHNIYRLGSSGAYRLIGVDGELEHGGFTEDKYTHAADTYGKIVGLDRKHMINDDMGAFSRIMVDLGLESAKTKEELVYMLLLGSLATLFPTNGSRKNYISGATSNLSVEGMTQMEALWQTQVDADNSPMTIPPSKILVGTNQKTIARQLYNQQRIEIPPAFTDTQRQFTDNPHKGLYPVVVSPYINNTAIKQRVSKLNKGSAISGQTQTGWFMLSDPNNPVGATLLVSLLNGNRRPTLESADMSFDRLGMLWRAYDDFGVDEGDYRFMAFSKGAA